MLLFRDAAISRWLGFYEAISVFKIVYELKNNNVYRWWGMQNVNITNKDNYKEIPPVNKLTKPMFFDWFDVRILKKYQGNVVGTILISYIQWPNIVLTTFPL